ncbi:unnamed protein product, partial [Trichogramma brassicae]
MDLAEYRKILTITNAHKIHYDPEGNIRGWNRHNMASVKEKLVNELHKPARRNYPRRSFVMIGIDDTWQADLVEMIPYAK